jgi:hypothetical protein
MASSVTLFVAPSCGLAAWLDDRELLEMVVRRSKYMLYRCEGRNQIEVCTAVLFMV